MKTEILLSPESIPGSTASVIVNGTLGKLFVQIIDAYGFQRELVAREIENGFEFTVYQHPGQRTIQDTNVDDGEKFIARFIETVIKYPNFLFNSPTKDLPRCSGFVKLCERIRYGQKINRNTIT